MYGLKHFFIAFIGMVMLGFAACNGDDDPEPTDSFDQAAMLRNLSSEVILPAYQLLKQDLVLLEEALSSFESQQDQASLDELRSAYSEVQLQWQRCSTFNFGPASENTLRLRMNIFPADTMQIVSNFSLENVDFGVPANLDAKGLPALDYLLFGSKSDVASINQPERLSYLRLNVEYMTTNVNEVLDAWSDSYQQEFESSLGTDVGSSLGQLVNELNYDFELVKNAKVGIPLGKRTLGVAQPEKVEAPHSALSTASIEAALNGMKTLFQGADGLGLDDYLDHLGAPYTSGSLSDAIIANFDVAIAANNAIQGSLMEAIEERPASVETLHAELQNLVVLLKTDMPSQLGVQITYQDNDGD